MFQFTDDAQFSAFELVEEASHVWMFQFREAAQCSAFDLVGGASCVSLFNNAMGSCSSRVPAPSTGKWLHRRKLVVESLRHRLGNGFNLINGTSGIQSPIENSECTLISKLVCQSTARVFHSIWESTFESDNDIARFEPATNRNGRRELRSLNTRFQRRLSKSIICSVLEGLLQSLHLPQIRDSNEDSKI